jgi:hypothetical protein
VRKLVCMPINVEVDPGLSTVECEPLWCFDFDVDHVVAHPSMAIGGDQLWLHDDALQGGKQPLSTVFAERSVDFQRRELFHSSRPSSRLKKGESLRFLVENASFARLLLRMVVVGYAEVESLSTLDEMLRKKEQIKQSPEWKAAMGSLPDLGWRPPMKIKVYVASSWRNTYQPTVVKMLRDEGHEVYDFKQPAPGDDGFHWREIDPNWKSWTPEAYAEGLRSPIAERGFMSDMRALENADLCVLLMPSGRSAAWEYGYWRGRSQRHGVLHIPTGETFEPELMFRGATITSHFDGLRMAVRDKKSELEALYARPPAIRGG